MADITLGQFYNAIAQGAREATLNALKDMLNKLDDLTAVQHLLRDRAAKVHIQCSDVTLPVAVQSSTELSRARLGALVPHGRPELARGSTVWFGSATSSPLNPGESATVVDIAGPGRLITA